MLAIDTAGEEVALNPVSGSTQVVPAIQVWSGDTDNNAVVEAADLFPIGNCFGLTGPARPGGFDISWQAFESTAWENFSSADPTCAPSGTLDDPGYADGSGDGVINQNEALAIGRNSVRHGPAQARLPG